MSSSTENVKPGDEKQPQAGGTPNPMAMGMGMMKKMMAQMRQSGEGPMGMMQKMIAQMKNQQGNEAGNPMQQMMGMCMGMCAEMLTALHKTTALATFISPELRKLFEDWIGDLENDTLKMLRERGEMDVDALAAALKISEESATYLITHLENKGVIGLRVRASAAK